MERKDYEEKFHSIKNDILGEIRNILGYDERHEFKDKFFVHYVEGEVATTEVCSAVEVWCCGEVVVCVAANEYVNPITRENETLIENESVFNLTSDSLIDILDNLKKEIRDKKIENLKKIIRRNGGELLFDGNFKFNGVDQGMECENNSLYGIYINQYEDLCFDTSWEGDEYVNGISYIEDAELDRIIAYAEEKTKKRKYTIRVSGSFSRDFDVEADSLENAIKIAKEEWLINPLCYDDSNGEDWDGHTL